MLLNNPYNKAYLNIINESKNIIVSILKRAAERIGGQYIEETNTIDCMGHKFVFFSEYIVDGTFDFKLTNASNDWSDMFRGCDRIS